MRKTVIYPTQSSSVINDRNSIHVVFLYGGMSSEREVSLMSAPALIQGLLDSGYSVTPVDMGYDFANVVLPLQADIVYNGLYGTYGEDGCVPGLLEIMGIKYTHSGVLASAVGFNKIFSGRLFQNHGILCPKRKIIERQQNISGDPMPRPYVIKPVSEGSSIGVIIVFNEDEFNFKDYDWPYGDTIIVEEYIGGQEIFVAVLGDKAIGALEINILNQKFCDYDAKYKPDMAKHIMPANIPAEAYQRVLDIALKAHKLIGCKSISRTDFKYDKGEFYLLEINTHPGITALSSYPDICAHHGITISHIVDKLVQDALYEHNKNS